MRDLLSIRDFRLLFVGQAGSNWGDAMTGITLLILTQRLTGSVAAVAGTAIAMALPQVLLGMLVGVYVDRWDRKKVMVLSDVVRGLLVLGFVLVGSADDLWILYTVSFAQAAAGTFFNPAKGAMLPAIVGSERLLAANSTMETSRVVFGVLGTGAAGLWIGLGLPIWTVFAVDAVSFIGSAFFEAAMRTESRPERPAGGTGIWTEMAGGVRTVLANRTLVGVVMGAGVVMLGLGAVNVLIVPFVVADLGVSETWFGALEGAQVTGMVLSGSLVAVLASRFRPTRILTSGLMAVGIGVAAISLVGAAWQLMALLFAVGVVLVPLQSSVSTLVQTEVPDAQRGRAGSALGTIIGVSNVTSMALAGTTGAMLGVRNVFVGAGVIAVIAGVLTALLFAGATPLPAGGLADEPAEA